MKKVSIIVPVYNVEKYLPKCIDSIINQKYSNIELILVDDGSVDKSPLICDEYAKKDKRIKVIHKENGGVSSARNRGLDVASGDYITFVDSDDFILESFSDFCRKLDQQDMLISYNEEKNKNLTGKIKKVVRNGRDSIIDFLIKNSSSMDTNSVSYKVFKKEIVQNLRFNEKVTVAEDLDFVLRGLCLCQKVELVPINYYYYYQRETSVMHDNSYIGIVKVINSGRELIRYYSENIDDKKINKKIISLVSGNIMSGVLVRYRGSCKEDKNMTLILVKNNIKLFSYVKELHKKMFYIFMRVFGLKSAFSLYCTIKK